MSALGFVLIDGEQVPYHLASADVLANLPVSNLSRWNDPVWAFGRVTAGDRAANVQWAMEMADGDDISSPQWAHLLDLARRVVWSVRVANRRGKLPKDSTIMEMMVGVRSLLRWMASAGYESFSEIDPAAASEYVDHLVESKVEVEAEDEITAEGLARHIDVLCRIYEQGPEMVAVPGAVMAGHPFGGRTAHEVAKDVTRKISGFIPPVPDPVYLAIMREALEWLGPRARDLGRLAAIVQRENRATHTTSNSYSYHLNKVLGAFVFNDDGRLAKPWHPQLTGPAPTTRWIARSGKRVARRSHPLSQLRLLLTDLRAACAIVIQGTMGIRISELAGLKAHPVDERQWPACIEVRPSMSGLSEVFYVRGRVFKTRDAWQEIEWVAGSRPAGTAHLPPPVQAILALHQAFEPWRARMQTDDLIFSYGGGSGIPSRAAGSPILSDVLRDGQKEFLARHVTLPARYEGWNLTTHQWRKSFALYVVRSDERLLPAVSDHFKHLSIAMTEQGYLGSDPELLGVMEDVATREAARLLFEAVNGQSLAAGKMAEVISANEATIKGLMGGAGTDEERISRLTEILASDDVRVWPAPWGKCLFRAETARCHHQDKGEFDLSARRPLYRQRSPKSCGDCSNLLVAPDIHGVFWRERHAENLRLHEQNAAAGEHAAAAVAAERARVSAAILRKMNLATETTSDAREQTHAGA